jgi:hypothetical protein
VGSEALEVIVGLVHQARRSDHVQQLLAQLELVRLGSPEGERALLRIVRAVGERGDQASADFLRALSLTTSRPKVRQAAIDRLEGLRALGVLPKSHAVAALSQPRFIRAYASDLGQIPEQQQVVFCWEMERGQVQALVVLVDHCEMLGAPKGLFLTANCTKAHLTRSLVGESKRLGVVLKEVGFEEAREVLTRSLKAAEDQHLKLPDEWVVHSGLIERRILEAPAPPLARTPTEQPL